MNQTYWESRYNENITPWDIGYCSPPLSAFFQNLFHKEQKILIPGAGNAYEAEWLWQNGFKNLWIVDLAPQPLKDFKERCPDFPPSQLLQMDFFHLDQSFDLIIEQTFFCAISPKLRPAYAKKMQELLNPGGKLTGLLFNFPLSEKGPPFGGSKEEYINHFKNLFSIHKMEACYNSIKPRQGNELFFTLIRS